MTKTRKVSKRRYSRRKTIRNILRKFIEIRTSVRKDALIEPKGE